MEILTVSLFFSLINHSLSESGSSFIIFAVLKGKYDSADLTPKHHLSFISRLFYAWFSNWLLLYRISGLSRTLWSGVPMKRPPADIPINIIYRNSPPYILTRARTHTQPRPVYIKYISFKCKYTLIKGIFLFKGYIDFIYKWIYKHISYLYPFLLKIMSIKRLITNIMNIRALNVNWSVY
jgi:hypothetical protein